MNQETGHRPLLIFVIPNQMLLWSGFRESSWYSPGYGVQMLVKRYLPGIHFFWTNICSRIMSRA